MWREGKVQVCPLRSKHLALLTWQGQVVSWSLAILEDPMEWEHKGLRFTITIEPMGELCLAAARVPREGMFVRVRPFSAIGRSEEEAVELLKDQIRSEYQAVPGRNSG